LKVIIEGYYLNFPERILASDTEVKTFMYKSFVLLILQDFTKQRNVSA